MPITFTKMTHHCTTPVTAAVEAYSPANGIAHGSLDATAYVCTAHVQIARDLWQDRGLTPYTAQAKGSTKTCGDITEFEDAPAGTDE